MIWAWLVLVLGVAGCIASWFVGSVPLALLSLAVALFAGSVIRRRS